MRKVIFDIETSNIFQDTGSFDPASLDIAVVGIHDSAGDSYRCFLQDELRDLWPILENTDLLIGFNSDHFDIPLLDKYYTGELTRIKSLDLMKEVRKALGRRIKLDTLAEATLGRRKIGHGLQAIGWWKRGEVEKVKNYCIEDVRITKDLYDHALRHGSLKYKDGPDIRELPLDTSGWGEPRPSGLTHTLPF